jgi:hypothetical protein
LHQDKGKTTNSSNVPQVQDASLFLYELETCEKTHTLQKNIVPLHSIPFNINVKWLMSKIVIVMTTNEPYKITKMHK